MRDCTPEYNAYFVTFYSTGFDNMKTPYTKQKNCVVLAENSITAEEMVEKMADKTFPNNCNSCFQSRLMCFHDLSPFVDADIYSEVIHFNNDSF